MLDFILAIGISLLTLVTCGVVGITCLLIAGTNLPDRPPEYYVDDELDDEDEDEYP